MKIGLVCPYNIIKGGGVQEIVRALCVQLNSRGHTARILTPQPREAGEEHLAERDVIFAGAAADFRSPLHTTAQLSMTADTFAIERMLEREQFDILHFHEPWVPMLSKQILSRSTSVNIATFHAKLPETMMSRTVARVVTPYTKSVLKDLHMLTAVSEAAAEYVASLTDAPISIIPNGIDLNRFKRVRKIPSRLKPGRSAGAKKILYIGRLERRKGVKYLLEAYALLQQKDSSISLIIAGDGPDRPKLEELVQQFGLTNVSFLGYVSDTDKLRLLAEADLFCSPALYGESFGIVLLETMATGLVTVAGNNAGYASLMRGVGSLSLINPRDIQEFARRLEVLLNQPELRRLWQKWAAGYVEQFSYKRVVDQYLAVYEQAYEHRREHVAVHEAS